MKFIIDKLTRCTPRIGVLQELERLPSFKLETPAPMLYTRSGSLPHITHEVLQQVMSEKNNIIQISLATTTQFVEPLKAYNKNLSTFVGLAEYPSCLIVQDPSDLTPSGHHKKNQIPLWTRSGKAYMTAEIYMNSVLSLKPDMYFILSDSDTNIASSTKRISKSVEHTIQFFKYCIEQHKDRAELKNKPVFASIAGGYDLKARSRCIKELSDHLDVIDGFVFDGLHNNGPEMEFLPFAEIKAVMSHLVNELPENKVRIATGCWNPVTVLNMIALGVDLFDTSYAHIVTERASALTFSTNTSDSDCVYEINLRDPSYAQDFRPLLDDCECYACSGYSKAYVNHLLNVQELLGSVLLSVHNLHHYLKFFKQIRKCINDGTFCDLQTHVSKQFEVFQKTYKSNKEIIAS